MCCIGPFGQEVVNMGVMEPVLCLSYGDAPPVGGFDVGASIHGGGSLLGSD